MATNFNKEGYSTGEVAQILGCSQSNVWRMVSEGEIEALSEKKTTRKVIRITRAALIKFLSEHRTRYSKELLEAFGIGDSASATDLPNSGVVAVKDLGGTTKPTGTWADLLKDADKKAEDTAKEQMRSPGYLATHEPARTYRPREQGAPITKPYNTNRPTNYAARNYNRYSCQILVNGRIAVGGISKSTARNIVDCLMEDPYMRPQSIEIRFVEEQ